MEADELYKSISLSFDMIIKIKRVCPFLMIACDLKPTIPTFSRMKPIIQDL